MSFPILKRLKVPFKVEFQIYGDTYYYKGMFNEDEEKKTIDIVHFACRDGKYRILKSMNDEDEPEGILDDEGLDVLR